MEYNIVTNYKIIQEAKKYKHYVVSLGFTSTVRSGGDTRVLSEKDKFAFFYNKRYNTTIYGQGCIGDISFYTDHYIKTDVLAIYADFEEFIFDFQWDIAREKGIEWYLGSLLKKIDEQLSKEKEVEKERQNIKIEDTKLGNPYKLVVGHPQYNPGQVTFDDIKAYKEAQRTGLIKNS